MQFLGRECHAKKLGKYPAITLGIDLSVSRAARKLGQYVPECMAASGDTIVSERILEAVDLSHPSVHDAKTFQLCIAAQQGLAELIVFDYCVGCVNVYDGNGNLLRDVDDYPCYSERHDKNVLWDGSQFWYIDYGHVFARTMWLFGLQHRNDADLNDTLPPHTVHSGFRTAHEEAIRKFSSEAIESLRKTRVVFQPNLWLPNRYADLMTSIYNERLNSL